MTVITFAKNNAFATSFDIRRSGRSRPIPAFRRGLETGISLPLRTPVWAERMLVWAAIMSALAMLAIVFLGTRAGTLILSAARMNRDMTKIESEVERLRVESAIRSNPEAIFERARMLQLITNDNAHYVSLGAPNELVLK